MTLHKQAFLVGASALLAAGTAIPATAGAQASPAEAAASHGIKNESAQATILVPRSGWVELRDTNSTLRGYIQIIGAGGSAKVLFRDAEQTPIQVQGAVETRESLLPLVLEEIPDVKADLPADIKLLREQIAVLSRNLTRLQERVNGLR